MLLASILALIITGMAWLMTWMRHSFTKDPAANIAWLKGERRRSVQRNDE
ncbi:MAG: hypothetical protein U1G05_00635 [Kiritimatiellia bacterium]